jgi:hypothetical protein
MGATPIRRAAAYPRHGAAHVLPEPAQRVAVDLLAPLRVALRCRGGCVGRTGRPARSKRLEVCLTKACLSQKVGRAGTYGEIDVRGRVGKSLVFLRSTLIANRHQMLALSRGERSGQRVL